MISDISKHPNHYSVLALVVSIGLLLFIVSWPNSLLQMLVILATTGFYMVWGIIHHHLLQDLSVEIVLEYVLIAALVIMVFWSLLM